MPSAELHHDMAVSEQLYHSPEMHDLDINSSVEEQQQLQQHNDSSYDVLVAPNAQADTVPASSSSMTIVSTAIATAKKPIQQEATASTSYTYDDESTQLDIDGPDSPLLVPIEDSQDLMPQVTNNRSMSPSLVPAVASSSSSSFCVVPFT